jgi:hypothetical protein
VIVGFAGFAGGGITHDERSTRQTIRQGTRRGSFFLESGENSQLHEEMGNSNSVIENCFLGGRSQGDHDDDIRHERTKRNFSRLVNKKSIRNSTGVNMKEMRRFRITLDITVPKEHVDEAKAMFHITQIVNDEFPMGMFFPKCSWDEKKIECDIKDLNP